MKEISPLSWDIEKSASDDLDRCFVCGVDEAGRGPLAGRVYAAAVVLPYKDRDSEVILALNDSKKLTEKKRYELSEKIKDTALYWSIAYCEVEEIEEYNILEASLSAMRKAIKNLGCKVHCALIDGNIAKGFDVNAKACIKGDATSPSIAAASILAKVARDTYCLEVMDREYPEYQFAKHKGYGTKAHYQAVEKYGLCPYHRKSFFKNYKGTIPGYDHER